MARIILKGVHGTYEFNPEDKGSLIGEGGMGRVFKGTEIRRKLNGIEEASNRSVAIKVLFRELTNNPNNIERIKIESTIKIEHKNLVEMLDFVEFMGKYHTISLFAYGKTLSQLIDDLNKKGQTIDLNEAKRIALEVADGIHELHKKRLIHRDIKASNIMMLNDGGIKLFDFGVIKKSEEVLQKLTSAGSLIGSIHYASPEQIRNLGGNSLNASTDVYSLGITMYEMITGKVPFDGESEYTIMEKQTKEIIPLHPALNKNVFNLIANATAKDQKYRYKNITEFRDDLLKIPNGHISLIRNAWWQKKQFKIAVVFILLILIATGAFFFFYSRYKKDSFAKNIVKATRFYSIAKYDSAKLYYANANNFIVTDSIQHKIMMLDALIPAMKDFYNAAYNKAFSELKNAEKLGSGDADYYLGELTYNGLGTIKDYKKGWEFSNKAVKRGFNMAYWRIALAYETGKGVKKDKDKSDNYYFEAVAAMKKLAEAGDPEALGNLGSMYASGSGVRKNEKFAFDYYLKSANTGYAFLECNLAGMYNSGTGVQKNLDEAVKWYTKSADKGHPTAELALGNLYLLGIGVTKDINKGLNLINKAADQNYSEALSFLGYLYYKGLYVAKDNSKSFEYTKKAVDFDNDNTTAIENLAFNYSSGTGVTSDYSLAKDYYLKAISSESPNSITDLVRIADLYLTGGYNLEQSEEKFVSFCEIAEKYGSALAKERLGIYYLNKGIASFKVQNYSRARSYFEKARNEGNRNAENDILYLNNHGY